MTSPSAPAPPAPRPSGDRPRADRPPRRGDRFFAWCADLGLARTDGWLGGVAAGLAARLRIDPLIVRGILLVAGLFGFPTLLLYAAAWALLPDADGRIHLRDLLRGRLDSAHAGILLCFVLGIVVFTPAGVFLLGMPGLSLFSASGAVLTLVSVILFVALLAVAGLLALIVRAARRFDGGPVGDSAPRASAGTAPDTSAAEVDSGTDLAAGEQEADAGGFDTAASAPAPEPQLGEAATPDEVTQWRVQHAAWKEQDQAWRRLQQDAERAARDQARRERQERAAAFADEAAQRRRLRRASSPRTSFTFVAIALGTALVVGAGVALLAADDHADFAGALGLFAAALVAAVAMVVAGSARRRSGFVAFVTAALLVIGLVASVAPFLKGITFGDTAVSTPTHAHAVPENALTQPWGTLWIDVARTGMSGPPMHVDKLAGHTEIQVSPGAELVLDLTLGRDVAVSVFRTDDDGVIDVPFVTTSRADGRHGAELTLSGTDPITTSQRLVLSQQTGSITVWVYDR